jgi:predicted GNAT family acetyltransferase
MRTMAANTVKYLADKRMFYLEMPGRKPDNSPHVVYHEISPQRWDFHHTETPRELQGNGYARAVVEAAFEHCRKAGIDFSDSSCSYVHKLIRESSKI